MKRLKKQISQLGIEPKESLGQHFLISEETIVALVNRVSPGSIIIEIGAGVGQLTEALATKAGKVMAIEIDRRYEPVLAQLAENHPNVEPIFGDALTIDFRQYMPKKGKKDEQKVQIVASLPFHISEPFLRKIVGLPFASVTLIVGDRFAYAISTHDENSSYFSQLTLLAQTFYDTDVIKKVDKKEFYPVPRTNAAIVELTPKEEHEFRADKRLFLLRRLFLTAKKSPLVKNALKEGLIEYERVNQAVWLTQNQARAVITKMGFPVEILDKPFEQLNNDELKKLSQALR